MHVRLKNNFLTDVLTKCREKTFSDKVSAGFMKINVKRFVIFLRPVKDVRNKLKGIHRLVF